ncbi:uncharacterized protein LOC110690077 [Chenopodium quinoa]|uniref:uncharacterized protein LOC110690077 n=1 Tax=Chenopodium quinoa TaxID=63459 RepID=UPI000B78AF13|nr:uncharacterized protein LOC110690077 [Chenopodium quinoa]
MAAHNPKQSPTQNTSSDRPTKLLVYHRPSSNIQADIAASAATYNVNEGSSLPTISVTVAEHPFHHSPPLRIQADPEARRKDKGKQPLAPEGVVLAQLGQGSKKGSLTVAAQLDTREKLAREIAEQERDEALSKAFQWKADFEESEKLKAEMESSLLALDAATKETDSLKLKVKCLQKVVEDLTKMLNYVSLAEEAANIGKTISPFSPTPSSSESEDDEEDEEKEDEEEEPAKDGNDKGPAE